MASAIKSLKSEVRELKSSLIEQKDELEGHKKLVRELDTRLVKHR